MVVRVAFPIAVPGLYDYRLPERFIADVFPGTPVKVDLRTRKIWGVAIAVLENSPYPNLKEVEDIRTDKWSDESRSLIKLYEWIAAYYQCDLGKVFKPLVRKNFTEVGAKTVKAYRVSGATPETLTEKQRTALEALRTATEELSRAEIKRRFSISDHMVTRLTKLGALSEREKVLLREADELGGRVQDYSAMLSEEQLVAVEAVSSSLGCGGKPFLLHGITGSGKTFVYIELVKRAMARGMGVIVLVPEISLTPQTIHRFRSAIGDGIAVIHSRMSTGERRDSLAELVSGKKTVVIGVRSAILAPLENVGLIIVDEEHDGSYKQDDPEPRYHARDVAVMRGKFQNAAVVLGSATPALESYSNVLSGKYELLKLQKRHGTAILPHVEIVDMNLEHKENNWTFLSRYLEQRMHDVLEEGRQIILLLNRRGFSVSLVCKECGHVYTCPNCSVSLVYHRIDSSLQCHLCNHHEPAPTLCMKCRGEQIKYRGTGIQKAEEFLQTKFPNARMLRMDQDSTRRKGAHINILSAFGNGDADILLGTQMVAKGLDFPGVRLVGVLQADIGLHFPDFRASERTFQLLTQVAGRAGRSDASGEVVIQTYVPNEQGIMCARTHDFGTFYSQEIGSREFLRYPPYAKLTRIVVTGEAEAGVRGFIEKAAHLIENMKEEGIEVLGPVPAVLAKVNRSYRYGMILKSASAGVLQRVVYRLRHSLGRPPKDIRLVVDVDPLSML